MNIYMNIPSIDFSQNRSWYHINFLITKTHWEVGATHQLSHIWTEFEQLIEETQIARFMEPTWGPPGSCRPQRGPMLAPWTLLSGKGLYQPLCVGALSQLHLLCVFPAGLVIWQQYVFGRPNGCTGRVIEHAQKRSVCNAVNFYFETLAVHSGVKFTKTNPSGTFIIQFFPKLSQVVRKMSSML